jgi:hypothetical protein
MNLYPDNSKFYAEEFVLYHIRRIYGTGHKGKVRSKQDEHTLMLLLFEAKASLPHGAFLPWVAKNLPFGRTRAEELLKDVDLLYFWPAKDDTYADIEDFPPLVRDKLKRLARNEDDEFMFMLLRERARRYRGRHLKWAVTQ